MHNDCLPLDVLEDVFLFYQVHEEMFYPLETLLLVCKFWSMAALGCRALWSNFKIHISHEPTIKMWNTRLPLRLARTGSNTLLDICLHAQTGPLSIPMSEHRRKMLSPLCFEGLFTANYKPCGCSGTRERSVASALELLAGEGGELCKRWRTLELELGSMNFCMDPHQFSLGETLVRGLTYPTPALKTVSLSMVRIRDPVSEFNLSMLPFTPSVEELDMYYCFVPWQLSIPNVRKVTIRQGKGRRYTASPKIRSLEGSKLIERLHLTIGPQSSIRLPSELPHLTRLTLDGSHLPLNFNGCRMPRIECLAIDVGHLGISRKLVLECPDFPFGQIRELVFRLQDNAHWSYGLKELRSSMLEILHGASSLVSLYSIEIIHSIVLKWLWEYEHSLKDEQVPGGGKGLYLYQKVVLSTRTSSCELSGHETCEELELLAKNWHILPPNVSWKHLLWELDKESSNSVQLRSLTVGVTCPRDSVSDMTFLPVARY